MEQSNYRRRTYTPEEDAIIINCVKESPDNISRALRQASQSIGRTYKAVSQHYYKYLTEPNHNNRTNACFMTVGKEQVNVNRKITREGQFATKQNPTPKPLSKWRRKLNIIFE